MRNKLCSLLCLLLAAALLWGCGNTSLAPAPTVETTLATEALTIATQPPTTAPTEPTPPQNPYGPEDFQLEDGYMTCTAASCRLGIDVSYIQQDIDWQQVKDAGIEFAMIRIAGRGWGEAGSLYYDDYWRQNYDGAKAAGLDVGCYFFSQAITEEEAVEEAEYLLAQLEGRPMDLPVVYDWEYIDPLQIRDIPRTFMLGKRALTECTKAFCDTIRDAGYAPMIYFNEKQSHKQMYLEELTDYQFWLAKYDTTLDYPYRVHMWQYTCEGTVPGISGHVDLNLYFPEA